MIDLFEITTEDLDIIKQLIEIGSKNGSISPANFITVGILYKKIVNILNEAESSDTD